jgi:hypothetical protein
MARATVTVAQDPSFTYPAESALAAKIAKALEANGYSARVTPEPEFGQIITLDDQGRYIEISIGG